MRMLYEDSSITFDELVQYKQSTFVELTRWVLDDLIDAASKSDVKQLAIFHHDPQHSDKYLDDLWVKYRSRYLAGPPKMDLFGARECLTLAV